MTLNLLAIAKQVEELIKNGGSGGTSDYEQLSKKPQINGHTLIGNKTAADLGITGGSDVPELTGVGKMLATKYDESSQPEMYWEDIYNMISANTNLYSTDESDIGKVFTKYGAGAKNIGWLNSQASYTEYLNSISGLSATNVQMALDELAGMISGGGGGTTEVTLFDDEVPVASGSVGSGWAEIPIADRVELFDENNLLKYSRIHMEVSFVTQLSADVRSRTENFSCDFDLNRILVSDAQDYSDPEYSSENDDNAQAYAYHAYLVNSGGSYVENAIEVNLNFNLFGTNPAPAVNTFSGRLKGLYFENRLVSTGAYNDLPSGQVIRVKITAK